MAHIRVKNSKYGMLTVSLAGRMQSFKRGDEKDSEVEVEKGYITGPEDLIQKIKNGALEVVDLFGLKIKGMPEVKAAGKPIEVVASVASDDEDGDDSDEPSEKSASKKPAPKKQPAKKTGAKKPPIVNIEKPAEQSLEIPSEDENE